MSVINSAISKDIILDELAQSKVVAVIRIQQADDLIGVSRALLAGGVKFVEITMTVSNALQAIRRTRQALEDAAYVGAGTVLTLETAREAVEAGANYIVSPITNPHLVSWCRDKGVVVMPGAMTPTEIYHAWQAGADVVKVFPAGVGRWPFFKDVKGPLPQIPLMPTGSVDFETAPKFIQAGAVAVGVGKALVSPELIKTKQYDQITSNAQRFIDLLH